MLFRRSSASVGYERPQNISLFVKQVEMVQAETVSETVDYKSIITAEELIVFGPR